MTLTHEVAIQIHTNEQASLKITGTGGFEAFYVIFPYWTKTGTKVYHAVAKSIQFSAPLVMEKVPSGSMSSTHWLVTIKAYLK
jgi:hypothetical protein